MEKMKIQKNSETKVNFLSELDIEKIEEIVIKARYVSQYTDSLIKEILSMQEKKTRPLPHNILNGEKNKNVYEIVCGELYRDIPIPPGKTKEQILNKLFWQCTRVAIADQFAGFAVHDEESRVDIEKYTFMINNSDTNKYERRETFWKLKKLSKDIPTSNKITSNSKIKREGNTARLWFLLAYYNILKKSCSSRCNKLDATYLNQITSSYAKPTSLMLPSEFFENYKFSQMHSKPGVIFSEIRKWAAMKLINKALTRENISSNNRYEEINNHKNNIFIVLEGLVTDKKEWSPAIAISLLMRILAGRYLNKAPRCEPRWMDIFQAGINYVLRLQKDGQWDVSFLTGSNPLLHSFSPLLHILDLGLDVIKLNHLPALSQASMQALDVLKCNLEDINLETDSLQDVLGSLFAGMSVGVIVYDRFKDILSDQVLDDFNAIDVPVQKNWSIIPKSLSFRKNLEEGILNQWIKESPHRPGAALIFGPPGTGKTTIAKVIAGKLNQDIEEKGHDTRWRFLHLSPADFAREGSDKIVASAERIFKQLTHVRRCVVLLDEMEEFLRSRGFGSDKDSRLVTTAFLPLLQDAVKTREIILVVATNFVGDIDPAVTRRGRFDLILPLGPPDSESRKEILRQVPGYDKIKDLLDKKKTSDQFFDLKFFEDSVVEYTMGYSHPEIVDFIFELIDKKLDLNSTHITKNSSNKLMLLTCRASFLMELWRTRCEKIPIALSRLAGCNWHMFADETRRYARYSSKLDISKDTEYWKEPKLPSCEQRAIK